MCPVGQWPPNTVCSSVIVCDLPEESGSISYVPVAARTSWTPSLGVGNGLHCKAREAAVGSIRLPGQNGIAEDNPLTSAPLQRELQVTLCWCLCTPPRNTYATPFGATAFVSWGLTNTPYCGMLVPSNEAVSLRFVPTGKKRGVFRGHNVCCEGARNTL